MHNIDAEKADSAHGLMDGERDQKEVVFNTMQQQQQPAEDKAYTAPSPTPASCE